MADVKCLAEKRQVPEWPYLAYLQPCSAGFHVLDKVWAGCPNAGRGGCRIGGGLRDRRGGGV